MENIEKKIDEYIERYVDMLMTIMKEYPNKVADAYEVYTNIWLGVYLRENDKLLAYELAEKGLMNFYHHLRGETLF